MPSIFRMHPIFFAGWFFGLFVICLRFLSVLGVDNKESLENAGTFLSVPGESTGTAG
jgi:hypothetical protein